MSTWFEASAPGRLDVMGGIADYSGSLVLQMPLREEAKVRLRRRNDFQCYLTSKVDGIELQASLDYRSLLRNGIVDYDLAKAKLHLTPQHSWTAYVLGCVLVAVKEKGIHFSGADFEITSDVPLGKGVSSSASIEVAVMKALQSAYEIDFEGTELARLAQRAENLVVGAPCGLMDQLASFLGTAGKLLPIVCQPDQLLPQVSIPDRLYFIGIDSGVRHSVGGSSYTDVRCAAFMGFSCIASNLGAKVDDLLNARVTGSRDALPFNGYLCNISVEEFQGRFEQLLPDTMSGREFLSKFQTTIDPITVVDPQVEYAVKACTSHPVFENARVQAFKKILESDAVDPQALGQLMLESHHSYSACGLGSERTDEMVEEFEKFSSIAGAKITGGGSGGTVCALAVGDEGVNDVLRVHSHFSKKYRMPLKLFK